MKSLLCAAVALLPLATAGQAQTAPDATAPAAAEITGEIIVTAQKRAQSLQDVSTSISAVAGQQLGEAGITSIEDLQVAVPNITIGDSFGFANLFIRGLGLNSVFANVDPSVTLYEDGAVISQPAAQLFSFFDLERVEVLRGPQGTLYGRNATGGTINLITAKPAEEFGGFVRAEVGNYSAVESEGAVTGGIAPGLAARFAYFVSSRDGFGRNIVTDSDVSNSNKRAFRGQIQFRPSVDLTLTAIGEYGKENDRSNALFFKRETFPGVLTDANPANDGLAAPGRGGFPTGNPRDYASTIDPSNDRETWTAGLTARWDVSDAISLTNIVNYRRFTSQQFQDLDLSSVVTSSVQEFRFRSSHWSEEFQVNLDLDRLKGVAGLYYFSENLFNLNAIGRTQTTDIFNPASPSRGRRVFLFGNGDTDTYAAFWNGSFAITGQLSIKGGGRYTHDKRRIDNENYIFVGPAPGTQLYIPGPDGQRIFKDYTNEAGLEWRPNGGVMGYYTYSEGFKAGTGQLGTNVGGIIDPETIRNHEIGLKSSFDDRRITLNLAAYTYKIKNLQLDQTLPGGTTGFITVFRNATSQKSRGVELDASWRPSPLFRSNLSLAWQHTEFGSFLSVNPTNPAQLPENIDGNRARNAPRWVGALHLEYDVPLANDGRITLAGDGSYRSRQFFSEFNDPLLSQGAYTILDAQIRYRTPDRRFTASVWVRNLTDKLVESANFALATGRVTGRTFLPPRTFGVAGRFAF